MKGRSEMVELKVPTLNARGRVQWMRAVVRGGRVFCPDKTVRRKLQSLLPPLGFSTAIPEPDWELGRLAKLYMSARIVRKVGGANRPIPPDAVF